MVKNPFMDEWKESRKTIARFDKNILDIRKYGFTFVTGLLTANGYIINNLQNNHQSIIFAKAAIVANLVLILALQFYENIYIIWQQAAVDRSEIIEKKLNLELTSYISGYAKQGKTSYYALVMYWGLLVAVYALVYYTLGSHKLFNYVLIIVIILSQVLIYFLIIRRQKKFGGIDWTMDRILVSAGEIVQITTINLTGKDALLTGYPLQIEDQEGHVIYRPPFDKKALKKNESYTWAWNTPLMNENMVYRVKINNVDAKYDPYLARKIVVTKNKESENESET